MERTPPRKRGRLKRSTTSSMGKGKDAAGTPSRIKPSASHKRKPAVNEGYNHWKHSSSPCFMIGSPLTILPGPLSPAAGGLFLNEELKRTYNDFMLRFELKASETATITANHTAKASNTTSRNRVFIWDVEAQPNRRAILGAEESRPDLVLSGHQDIAEFALAMCRAEPFVLSGGRDKSVVLWSIQDHVSTLANAGTQSAESASSIIKAADNSTVGSRGIFQGHTDTVEDVQFCPSSSQQFCSVGDDSCLIFWDARIGSDPVVKVHVSASGVSAPVHKFSGHSAAVLSVQLSPDKCSVFGSCAEDGLLNIWDYEDFRLVRRKTQGQTLILQQGCFSNMLGTGIRLLTSIGMLMIHGQLLVYLMMGNSPVGVVLFRCGV
ncbi:WD-40 repeat-containing protein MSI4-like [Salvia splendens]|uniref:WD-40 repeat-containing protein MSI4-like n=1 Tax=Salvia splendens TaxID=180675 RepID=UPI001C27A975|nr:WD-40 repeat-containing protein MSI4-like [Salvia splendens]